MDSSSLNKHFYKFAYKFLVNRTQGIIDEKDIQSYLTVPDPEYCCESMNDVFRRMLFSAQNRQMSVNVIGGSIGGVENLSSVLNDFDVHFVSDKYSNKADILLMDITKTFNLDGKIKTGAKSLWPQYCKTIVSIATFLSQFDDYAKMLQWINTFYNDEKSMAALPLVISEEIFGF